MNPFSGFMQAITGSIPGFGDKTGNIGKGIHGLPDSDGAILFADDRAGSFLEWVQTFMNNAATVDDDLESVSYLQHSDLVSDLPAIDELKVLVANVKDQSSAGQDISLTLNGDSLDKGHVPLPEGIISAIIAHHESRHFSDAFTHEAMPEVPEMGVAKENAPKDGQAQAVAEDPIFQTAVPGVPIQAVAEDPIFQTAVPGVPIQAAAEDPIFQTAVPGVAIQAVAEDPISQAAVPGVAIQAGQADERQNKDSLLDLMMNEDSPEAGVEKNDPHSLSKPVVSAGDDGQANTNRFMQERLPSGPVIADKATEPATPQLQAIAGKTKDPESMVTGLTDQKAASSEDDTANFRDKDNNPTQRVRLANVNEEEWQKGQASDSVKSTIPEQAKSQPFFQDTEKAISGDPSTNMAVKQTPGPPAALTRAEESAGKTFQTTVMDQLVDKAAMRSIHGRSEIQIRLKPEFLGNVQMNIAADKEQLVVRIMTDRPMVKEIIETHLHQLKTELQNQGLTIDKFEVLVNPDAGQHHSRDQFAQMFKHQSSQNGRRQPHEQDPETLNPDGGKSPDDDRPTRDGVNYFA